MAFKKALKQGYQFQDARLDPTDICIVTANEIDTLRGCIKFFLSSGSLSDFRVSSWRRTL